MKYPTRYYFISLAIVIVMLLLTACGGSNQLVYCDPLGENDSDTQMICDIATDETNREEFIEYFATGKISGEARISRNGAEAEVPFLFGPDGDREETMNLINRDGQWYLSSF